LTQLRRSVLRKISMPPILKAESDNDSPDMAVKTETVF
jgi:hypothetical protein